MEGWITYGRDARTPEGYVILDPVERVDAPVWILRVWDPESDTLVCENVSVLRIAGARDHTRLLGDIIRRMLHMLDCVAWAARRYANVPRSWQSAYARVAGEWPVLPTG